jgi:3-oxoacyl-[acyl-carrier-protein] synthase II
MIHAGKNCVEVDPDCDHKNLVYKNSIPHPEKNVKTILNNSFGMLGINSTVIVKKFDN